MYVCLCTSMYVTGLVLILLFTINFAWYACMYVCMCTSKGLCIQMNQYNTTYMHIYIDTHIYIRKTLAFDWHKFVITYMYRYYTHVCQNKLYKHTHVHTFICEYTYTYIFVWTCKTAPACTHTLHIHVHIAGDWDDKFDKHTHVHTFICEYIYIYIHIWKPCMHAHTDLHIHTYSRQLKWQILISKKLLTDSTGMYVYVYMYV